jgi:hypothetical protein
MTDTSLAEKLREANKLITKIEAGLEIPEKPCRAR